MGASPVEQPSQCVGGLRASSEPAPSPIFAIVECRPRYCITVSAAPPKRNATSPSASLSPAATLNATSHDLASKLCTLASNSNAPFPPRRKKSVVRRGRRKSGAARPFARRRPCCVTPGAIYFVGRQRSGEWRAEEKRKVERNLRKETERAAVPLGLKPPAEAPRSPG